MTLLSLAMAVRVKAIHLAEMAPQLMILYIPAFVQEPAQNSIKALVEQQAIIRKLQVRPAEIDQHHCVISSYWLQVLADS
jgi:hypothetical protein